MASSDFGDVIKSVASNRGISVAIESHDPWIYVNQAKRTQGWKLHISVRARFAVESLRSACQVLLPHGVAFKVACDAHVLAELNGGRRGASQVGKFLTVYPDSDEQAVILGKALHEACGSFEGPAIPTDKRIVQDSSVFYRYGSFVSRLMNNRWGQVVSAIADTKGVLHEDIRSRQYHAFEWITDPFDGPPNTNIDGSVAKAFFLPHVLATSLMFESARGELYLGIDIRNQRRCIIKTARTFACEEEPSGFDSRASLKLEFDILTFLSHNKSLPRAYEYHDDAWRPFCILEDVPGPTLAEYVSKRRSHGQGWTDKDLRSGFGKVLEAIRAIHENGVFHNDLKPDNIIIDSDGQVRLIDFGAASSVGTLVLDGYRNAGTLGFAAPHHVNQHGGAHSKDFYSLGMILLFMVTGHSPPELRGATWSVRDQLAVFCPEASESLVELIGVLLQEDASVPCSSVADLCKMATFEKTWLVSPRSPQIRQNTFEQSVRVVTQNVLAGLTTGVEGIKCHTTTKDGIEYASRDLYSGLSGVGVSLSAYLEAGVGTTLEHDAVKVALDGICNSLLAEPKSSLSHPGLFLGESGAVIALLAAELATKKPQISHALKSRSEWIANQPYEEPDIYFGAAGRLKLYCQLLNTHDSTTIRMAESEALSFLHDNAVVVEDELWWSHGQEIPSVDGARYIGYSHGIVGIADAALDYYRIFGGNQALEIVESAARTLQRYAVALPRATGWPALAHDQGVTAPFWCHGAGGITRFLVNAITNGVSVPGVDMEQLLSGAIDHMVSFFTTSDLSLCHGASGCLLSMRQANSVLSDPKRNREADRMNKRLQETVLLASESRINCVQKKECGLMTGYAGVLLPLLWNQSDKTMGHINFL